jgi:hypothetical protein
LGVCWVYFGFYVGYLFGSVLGFLWELWYNCLKVLGDFEMSLREDILKELENKKAKKQKKEDKILEVREDIELMLENEISLNKQIELLIKNQVIEKIDLKYYREILKKHFNYQPKKSVKKTAFSTPKELKKATLRVASPSPHNVATSGDAALAAQKSNIDVLSQDIDLKF